MSDTRSKVHAAVRRGAAACVTISLLGSMPAMARSADGVNGAASGLRQGKIRTGEEKKPRVYCVDAESSGTRMTRRVCKTREEWMRDNDFDPILRVG